MTTTTITTSGTYSLGAVLGIGPTAATLAADNLNVTVNFTALSALSAYTIDGSSGSTVTIDPAAIAVGSSLDINTDGADVTLEGGGLAVGALSGTTIDINNGGTFQTGAGVINANVLTGSTISFGSGGGTDLITNAGTFLPVDLLTSVGPIEGFTSSNDIIDDQALNYADITGYTISGTSGGTETIAVTASDGSNLTFAIAAGTFTTGDYTLGSGPLNFSLDGTGTKLTLCFLGGTMIATPHGETAVEDLRHGDLVRTADGKIVPVRWVGINTVSTRFADPLRTLPVRISAGALGDNLPRRDLLLSPDHAVCLDGILVHASALVDDAVIRHETRMPETFRYYHVEVAAHDLILAEGVPAETFVDNVTRMSFDNWEEFMQICDGEPPTGEMAYPRAKARRQLPATLSQRLAAAAEQLQVPSAA